MWDNKWNSKKCLREALGDGCISVETQLFLPPDFSSSSFTHLLAPLRCSTCRTWHEDGVYNLRVDLYGRIDRCLMHQAVNQGNVVYLQRLVYGDINHSMTQRQQTYRGEKQLQCSLTYSPCDRLTSCPGPALTLQLCTWQSRWRNWMNGVVSCRVTRMLLEGQFLLSLLSLLAGKYFFTFFSSRLIYCLWFTVCFVFWILVMFKQAVQLNGWIYLPLFCHLINLIKSGYYLLYKILLSWFEK